MATYSEELARLEEYNDRTQAATEQYEENLTDIQTAVDSCEQDATTATTQASLSQTYANQAKGYRDEASEIAGLDQVVDVLAITSLGRRTPDVFIPFNEGGEMERGYGTFDSNGNRAVDFSRASVSGGVNKSGESYEAAVDELIIGSKGAGQFQSYINKLLWSEDFSNGVWFKLGTTISSNVATAPDGTPTADKLIPENTPSSRKTIRQNATFTIGNAITSKIHLKAAEFTKAIVLINDTAATPPFPGTAVIIDLTNGSTSPASDYVSVAQLNDGWYEVTVNGITGTATSNKIEIAALDDSAINENTVTGDGVSGIYIWGAQSVDGLGVNIPYQKTEGTAVSRSADVCSIPMRNNMPAAGKPFTIMVDGSLRINDKGETLISEGNGLFFIGSQRESGDLFSNRIVAFLDDGVSGNSRYVTTPTGIDYLNSRFTMRYTGAEISLFINGDEVGTTTITGIPTYDISSIIRLGSKPGSSRVNNNYQKNFRIFHAALSNDEIKAYGGAD